MSLLRTQGNGAVNTLPDVACFVLHVHGVSLLALELLAEVLRVGEGPDHAELGRAVGISEDGQVLSLRGVVGTPHLQEHNSNGQCRML